MRISGISIPPPPDPAQLQYALGGLNLFVGVWLIVRTLRGKKCPRWYLYFSGGSAIVAGALQIKMARDLTAPAPVAPQPQPQQPVTQAIAAAQPTTMPTQPTPIAGGR
ncbi:MAG: hypothetical protein ACYTGE_11285 [Planctomycetota bacterium]|jgi:hypothetical protein